MREQIGDGFFLNLGAFGQPGLCRGGDAPAAGRGFDRHRRTVARQAWAEVTQLGGHAGPAGIDVAVDHQGAADAAADGDVEDDPLAAAEPKRASASPAASASLAIAAGSADVCRHHSARGKSLQPSI